LVLLKNEPTAEVNPVTLWNVKPPSQKVFFSLLIASLLVFYTWLVFAATHVNLPNKQHPIQFYSNQTRQDIKSTFYQAIKNAHISIFLSVYGITDPHILALLSKKSEEKIPITVEYDPSASSNLKKILSPSINVHPIKAKGLMHRKILLLDEGQVFLGSANLTLS
jgi:hypothetical protein